MAAKKKASTRRAPSVAKLAAARRRLATALEKKLGVVRALRAEGASSWDDLWETVGDIVLADPPLWRGKYASESEFVREELPGETGRSVRRNVLVAGTFRPKDIRDIGPTILEELALYLAARAKKPRPPKGVDLDRVVVAVPRAGGEAMKIAARAVDLSQLRAARRALAKGEAASSKRMGAKEKKVRAALATKESLSGVSVRATARTVSIGNVPFGALGDLARALAKVRF